MFWSRRISQVFISSDEETSFSANFCQCLAAIVDIHRAPPLQSSSATIAAIEVGCPTEFEFEIGVCLNQNFIDLIQL